MEEGIAENALSTIVVQDRSSLTGANNADMEILAKLDEKLRFIEQKKINANDPTYYLTLDQISLANPTLFAASIKKITDIQNQGKNRVAYLYPILLSQHSKPTFQLFLIYPPKNRVGIRDAGSLRRAAMAKSEPLLRSILEAKRSRPTDIEEEDPGAPLLKLDGSSGARFYPDFFSLEYDLRRLLKKSFDKVQLPYIEIPDFFVDLKDFFARSPDLVDKIGEKYHIVIDQLEVDENGNYTRTPEVIRHYRILADGLEKFALNILVERAKKAGATDFITAAESYRAQYVIPAEPGRKQNKEKVEALVHLVERYPFERIPTKEASLSRNAVNDILSWLTVLIRKKDQLVERKQQQGVENLLQKIENLVQSYTKQNLDLLQIDLRREILRAVKEESQAMALENDFEKRLTTRYGSYKVTQADGSSYFYFVDQKYMSSVLENLSRAMKTDSSAAERFDIANKIFEQLVKRKDPALDHALSSEERIYLSQMKAHNVNEINESMRSALRANRYNIPQGILVSLISTILFSVAIFYSTQLFWLVFPLLLLSVISFYRIKFNRKTSSRGSMQESESKSRDDSTDNSVSSAASAQQDALKQKVAAYGSAMVFPFSPSKQSERVLTEDEFRAKVKMAAPEIKKNIPELSKLTGSALEEATYEALREDAVCIMVPTDIVKKSVGRVPIALYINYKDFADDKTRTKIADEYRQIFKPNLKDYEQEFYRYLINTLEIKYYTYLKKHIKK